MQVNLRHGLRHGVARTGHERDTCTSCAGTMILEFAALSRLSGETIFEVIYQSIIKGNVSVCKMFPVGSALMLFTFCLNYLMLMFKTARSHSFLQEKARKAMNFLWKQRHRSSDLVGTVINIHTGDWIRRGNFLKSRLLHVPIAFVLPPTQMQFHTVK